MSDNVFFSVKSSLCRWHYTNSYVNKH